MAHELAHRTNRMLSEGSHYPLGATLAPGGANFSLYSANAEEVFLLLFDRPDGDPTDVIRVGNRGPFRLARPCPRRRARPALRLQGSGPVRSRAGIALNDRKLLADPYAKALTGKFLDTENRLLAYDPLSPEMDLSLDRRDNTRAVPKSIVVDDRFDWQGDSPPSIPLERMVNLRDPPEGVHRPPLLEGGAPGTYLGFVEKIPYLQSLGVNAVELLPCTSSTSTTSSEGKGSRITGDTTRPPSSPRTSPSAPVAAPGARWRSSRRWCGSCTARGSR